ncbi:MAG TPA: hypothetical protein PKM63_16975 [Panacibacter sp.]|nr:hypothetical protein [Panacibacter sp.]HNP45988.1 hypothetical protein [Panacibacter sp.]
MSTTRICLWSSPRNISTAMMYSFAQRQDTIAFDEPLYAHYLRVTGVVHPGQEEILATQQNDGNKVVNNLLLGNFKKPVAFFKQMTHHLVSLDENFLSKMKNILFIRDPKQIISSYAQVRPDVNMQDIGIAKQWELYNQLTENNLHCVVLDSNEILKSPEKVLRDLCSAIDIRFDKAMLHWPAGPKKEDGCWAKYWYDNVHKSTGFERQSTSSRALPEYLEPLYNESKKYYEQLFEQSIKA